MPFEEFVIDGTTYVLSRDAARAAHFTQDYVSRLARRGVIDAKRLGPQWVVNLASLNRFVAERERQRPPARADLAAHSSQQ